MRVLASVLPGTGHLLPLVSTLHALRDAGHTVVVASAEPLRAEVKAAGLDFAPVGPPWHESDAEALMSGFQAAGPVGSSECLPSWDRRSCRICSIWSATCSGLAGAGAV
jgi:hypothetical protein